MHPLVRTAAAAGLVLLAACGDGGTGPGRSLALTATGYVSDPEVLALNDGVQRVACMFTFSVAATGDAGASAEWAGATLRFFIGADRATPFDSLALTATELAEYFKAPRIREGEQLSMSLGLAGSIPFGMEAVFRYRVEGRDAVGETEAYVPCVVPVQNAGSAPPVVTGPFIDAGGGPPEPGDTVRISWTAASTTGLWETGIAVTGAVSYTQRVPAAYASEMRREVTLVIPGDVRLGEPLRVQVYAVDLLARSVAPPPVASAPVVDATPPRMTNVLLRRMTGREFGGQHAGGDSLLLSLDVVDNHKLAWVIWEFGMLGSVRRDSVAVRPALDWYNFVLRSQPGWNGPAVARVQARDSSGNLTPATEFPIRFHPLRAAESRSTTVDYRPQDLAIDTRRGRIYVSAQDQPGVMVHSLASLARVATVSLPENPLHLDLSADGGTLVALLSGQRSIALIDPATLGVRLVPLDLPDFASLYGVGVASNGRVFVLARLLNAQSAVVEYNLATGAQRRRTDAPQMGWVDSGVSASLDHTRLLLGVTCLYRADTDAFGPCADTGLGRAHGSGTGAFWSNGPQVFGASLAKRLEVPEFGISALSADDRHAYVGDFGRVMRVRIADGVVDDALAATLNDHTRASADGAVLVSVSSSGELQVIELP